MTRRSIEGRCWPAAICFAGLLAVTGCALARNDFIQLNPGTSLPARDADAPVVLTVGDLDRPYQELGVLHLSGYSREGYDRLNDRLREKARQVGADSVIFVRYETENAMSLIPFFISIPYDVLTVDGVAVRSK